MIWKQHSISKFRLQSLIDLSFWRISSSSNNKEESQMPEAADKFGEVSNCKSF